MSSDCAGTYTDPGIDFLLAAIMGSGLMTFRRRWRNIPKCLECTAGVASRQKIVPARNYPCCEFENTTAINCGLPAFNKHTRRRATRAGNPVGKRVALQRGASLSARPVSLQGDIPHADLDHT